LLGRGLVDHRLDFLIEQPHDLGRRAARRENAEPRAHLPARQAGFRRRRHIGKMGEALLRARSERLELARLQVRLRRAEGHRHYLHAAGEKIRQRAADAFVRHMNEAQSGDAGEELHREMRRAAEAGRAVIDLARLRLGVGNELAQVLRRHGCRHDQDVRDLGDIEHRHQIGHHVEAQSALEEGFHHQPAA
jgi:hypothetical protein